MNINYNENMQYAEISSNKYIEWDSNINKALWYKDTIYAKIICIGL